jgi:hypothetical protein
MGKSEYILTGVLQNFETKNTPSRVYSTRELVKIMLPGLKVTDHVKLYEDMHADFIDKDLELARYYLQEAIWFRTERIMKKYCS